jgi:hypothetical protein
MNSFTIMKHPTAFLPVAMSVAAPVALTPADLESPRPRLLLAAAPAILQVKPRPLEIAPATSPIDMLQAPVPREIRERTKRRAVLPVDRREHLDRHA